MATFSRKAASGNKKTNPFRPAWVMKRENGGDCYYHPHPHTAVHKQVFRKDRYLLLHPILTLPSLISLSEWYYSVLTSEVIRTTVLLSPLPPPKWVYIFNLLAFFLGVLTYKVLQLRELSPGQ